MTNHSKHSPRRTGPSTPRSGRTDKVVIAYIHPGQVSAWFHHSVVDLLMYDNANRQRITGKMFEFSGANLSSARNKLVTNFLAGDGDWLWMLDADMVFPPDTLDALMSNASPDRAPIVGGLCFGINDGRLFPTMYAFQTDEDTGQPVFCRINGFETGVMMPVHATGAACLLIHRTVLEAMRDRQFNAAFPWFQETQLGDLPCGEDITFCLRAGQLGFPIHVDTGVDVGHHKDHLLTVDLFNAQKEEAREPAHAG